MQSASPFADSREPLLLPYGNATSAPRANSKMRELQVWDTPKKTLFLNLLRFLE